MIPECTYSEERRFVHIVIKLQNYNPDKVELVGLNPVQENICCVKSWLFTVIPNGFEVLKVRLEYFPVAMVPPLFRNFVSNENIARWHCEIVKIPVGPPLGPQVPLLN
jgi:hypothetical protein